MRIGALLDESIDIGFFELAKAIAQQLLLFDRRQEWIALKQGLVIGLTRIEIARLRCIALAEIFQIQNGGALLFRSAEFRRLAKSLALRLEQAEIIFGLVLVRDSG